MELKGYAICTTPRTGSNLLCDLLASTKLLGRPLEYFETAGRRHLDRDPTYPDDPKEQIAKVLQIGATPNGVYGLKLFPHQHDRICDRVRWSEELPGLKFVLLERRDLLGQAISMTRARQTSQFRSTMRERKPPTYTARGIHTELTMLLTGRIKWTMFFTRTGIEPLHEFYEDFVENRQATIDRIARLVGVDEPAIIDERRVSMGLQRDKVSDDWRARFIADFGDLDRLDDIVLQFRKEAAQPPGR